MTIDDVFKRIQKIISDIPLILAGTGTSIPYGIPGMYGLSVYLRNELSTKYVSDSAWVVISSRLENGVDLESALTQVTPEPSEALLEDITVKTWKFITEADLACYRNLLASRDSMPLARLFCMLAQSSRKNINIITTNYDRIIEYACDQARLEVDDRFRGKYNKWQTYDLVKRSNIVNLLKVHGSLDFFKDSFKTVHSIPMCCTIPDTFVPDIVPPGSNKYRSVLQGIHRDLLHDADDLIKSAPGFLCIGYGFNDEQIQSTMLEQISLGKPVIVLTKEITDKTANLLRNKSQNYITITEDSADHSKTCFVINGDYIMVDGTYWTVEGFLNIIV